MKYFTGLAPDFVCFLSNFSQEKCVLHAFLHQNPSLKHFLIFKFVVALSGVTTAVELVKMESLGGQSPFMFNCFSVGYMFNLVSLNYAETRMFTCIAAAG